jgi:hypothetical protein
LYKQAVASAFPPKKAVATLGYSAPTLGKRGRSDEPESGLDEDEEETVDDQF